MKSGQLFEEEEEKEDKLVFEFSQENNAYKDKLKEIFSEDREKGFMIRLNKYVAINDS